jgi:hypothetical protein
MKKIIYLLIFVFSFWGIAQNQTIITNNTESGLLEDARWVDEIKAMHTIDNKISTVRVEKKHILWDIFDVNMDREHQEHIKKTAREYYLGYVNIGNEIKFFTYEKVKLSSLRNIICYRFNISTKTYTREILFKSDYVEELKPSFLQNTGRDINFAASPNQQYIAISANSDSPDYNSYTVHVFDSNTLKKVYQNAFSDQKGKNHDHEQLEINNEGTVYSLGRTFFKGWKNTRNFKPNYDYTLVTITKDKTITTNIPSEDKVYRSFEIYESGDEVRLIGFSRIYHRNDIKTICMVKLAKNDMKLLEKKDMDIPSQIYYDLFRKGKANRKIKSKSNLTKMMVDDLYLDSNGNAYMVTHRAQHATSGGGGGFPMATPTGGGYSYMNVGDGGTEEGEYEHIVVFKFDPSGELVWGRGINRVKQSFKHKAFLKNDQLHVVLTADCKLSPRSDGRMKIKSLILLNERCLFDITFDKAGEINYNTFSLKNTEGKFYDVTSSFYMDGILLVPQATMRKKRFIKFY